MRLRKFLMLAVILGLFFAALVAHRVEALHADEHGITLASLAGSFVESIEGFGTFCVGGCAAPTTLIPVHSFYVGQKTYDDSGNSCGVLTVVAIPVAGTKNPASTNDITLASTVTTFDPITESGERTDHAYAGGSCTGAVFNSDGATLGATCTVKFVVSQNANHITTLHTSCTFTSVTGGGALFFGTEDRQDLRH